MPDQNLQPHQDTATRAAAVLVDTRASWLAPDDDLALGCECADPALQIERWAQECGFAVSAA